MLDKNFKKSSKFSRINKTLGYYWFDGNNITTPYRINARVNEIEKKYLSKLSITVYPAWMIHQKGIALLWDKKYEQALKYFLKAFKSYKSIKRKLLYLY